jgi:nucleoid DNA-binding protein
MKKDREIFSVPERMIKRIAKKTGIVPDDVRVIVGAAFDEIKAEVIAGKWVLIHRFGVFNTKIRPPKRAAFLGGKGAKAKKPRVIIIPETKVIRFRPSPVHFQINQ